MTVKMNLQKEYLDLIKAGKKIYEVRLLDEKRSMLSINDIIEFHNLNDVVLVKILNIYLFENFEELLNEIPSELIGLSKNKSIALNELYSIYPDYKNNSLKAIAIEIEKVAVP